MPHDNTSSNEPQRIYAAVEASADAIAKQLYRVHKKSPPSLLDNIFLKAFVVAFLHGFIRYYAYKHDVSNEEHVWLVTNETLSLVFGQEKGTQMMEALLHFFQWHAESDWVNLGDRAAYFSEIKSLDFLAGFIEGQVQLAKPTKPSPPVLKV